MECSHDWIEQNAAGKSGVKCAASLGQRQQVGFRNIT